MLASLIEFYVNTAGVELFFFLEQQRFQFKVFHIQMY